MHAANGNYCVGLWLIHRSQTSLLRFCYNAPVVRCRPNCWQQSVSASSVIELFRRLIMFAISLVFAV